MTAETKTAAGGWPVHVVIVFVAACAGFICLAVAATDCDVQAGRTDTMEFGSTSGPTTNQRAADDRQRAMAACFALRGRAGVHLECIRRIR